MLSLKPDHKLEEAVVDVAVVMVVKEVATEEIEVATEEREVATEEIDQTPAEVATVVAEVVIAAAGEVEEVVIEAAEVVIDQILQPEDSMPMENQSAIPTEDRPMKIPVMRAKNTVDSIDVMALAEE